MRHLTLYTWYKVKNTYISPPVDINVFAYSRDEAVDIAVGFAESGARPDIAIRLRKALRRELTERPNRPIAHRVERRKGWADMGRDSDQ
jgi:hypothetical protein